MLGLNSEVAYIYSIEASRSFDLLPSNIGRSSMVHALVQALNLFRYMEVYQPTVSTQEFLEEFHSPHYLRLLLSDSSKILKPADPEILEEYGLVDDCALFTSIADYVRFLGGSAEAALNALDDGHRYVINWDGGRHHAQSTVASGYCFINDVVLLMLKLQQDYSRILYIDFDLHHGDGVEKAFYYSDRVFILSLHKFLPGFFPGSGSCKDNGSGSGYGFTCNVPINFKISGEGYFEVFSQLFTQIHEKFDPDIVVCVCGADILSTDPHQGFDIGSDAFSKCLSIVLETKIPAVFLGGGGYNHADTAKCWSILTHEIISSTMQIDALPEFVPDHDFWPQYVTNDRLDVISSSDKDLNERQKIQDLISSIEMND